MPPVLSAGVPAPVTTVLARTLCVLSPPVVSRSHVGVQVPASGIQSPPSACAFLPSAGVPTLNHALLSLGWLLVAVAYFCILAWTFSSWLLHRLLAVGMLIGLEGQIQALATGRLPTVGSLSPPLFPWRTPVTPVIQTLSVYRGFHVRGRRCLWCPYSCSVAPTFLVLLGGTPSHYPGDDVCPSYGQAVCPHRPVFSAKSLVPGQLPPGSSAASNSSGR